MTRPMTKIVNGDEEIIREMTEQEYAEHLEAQAYWEKEAKAKADALAEAQAAKDAAIAKLSALGLDLDDLKALGF